LAFLTIFKTSNENLVICHNTSYYNLTDMFTYD